MVKTSNKDNKDDNKDLKDTILDKEENNKKSMKKRESKKQKFNRIAIIRTNKVLKSIRSLAKLSNTRRYDFNQRDIGRIFGAIRNEMMISKAMFDKSLKDNEFTL